MEYNVDEKNFIIELKGDKREIKKFARCLVEIVDKHLLSELKSFKINECLQQLNLNRYQRIYLSNNSITYLPNVGSDEAKSFHFNFIKENYEKAKEKYLNL
jgi:hypothetical protein